ncbi:hypothetical protein BC833DRAFT_601101 [Globomyces pollinis-pini]|nr:hypothetical protein BC833DRAFT_601101 [Globomyces pollinis-pini]
MPLQPTETRNITNFWKSSAPMEGIPVNPKGHFANERTFLHWLNLCLILGSLGLGLFNFGSFLAQVSGMVFTTIAVGFMFYALVQYHVRGDLLAVKDKGIQYQDMVGALLMVFVVFVAVTINFGLHFLSSS